jgi:hypothetical protein
MPNRRMPLLNKRLLRKRALRETVIAPRMNISPIEQTRHRRRYKFLGNLVAGLITYSWRPLKPSLGIRPAPPDAYLPTNAEYRSVGGVTEAISSPKIRQDSPKVLMLIPCPGEKRRRPGQTTAQAFQKKKWEHLKSDVRCGMLACSIQPIVALIPIRKLFVARSFFA